MLCSVRPSAREVRCDERGIDVNDEELKMVNASGAGLNGQMLYLPEVAAWKILSSAPDTGPGRLMIAGSKSATVFEDWSLP